MNNSFIKNKGGYITMAVERIEEYRQKDGTDVLKVILKPSKNYPDGYFYCDAEDIDLVQNYFWRLISLGNIAYVRTGKDSILFHREVFKKRTNYYANNIDHYSHVGFDNVSCNLYEITSADNARNKKSKGYHLYRDQRNPNKLRWQIQLRFGNYFLKHLVTNELEACKTRYWLEQEKYIHPYIFLIDRSQSLDLLDLERTGQISAEEAIYRHVMKYADNAWYYYRYGLEQYFKDNNIPVPAYSIDEQGFMVHPITGQKLCPL